MGYNALVVLGGRKRTIDEAQSILNFLTDRYRFEVSSQVTGDRTIYSMFGPSGDVMERFSKDCEDCKKNFKSATRCGHVGVGFKIKGLEVVHFSLTSEPRKPSGNQPQATGSGDDEVGRMVDMMMKFTSWGMQAMHQS